MDKSFFRVLSVDDEPDIREVVQLSLALDPGLDVRICGSGVEAIALSASWRPDVIICDVMMPDMDGPSTLTRLRELPGFDEIPFVFMTARTQRKEIAYFESLGADGVIKKPFDPMTLASVVRGHLPAARNVA
jgi:two-component system OmpR family response regulator